MPGLLIQLRDSFRLLSARPAISLTIVCMLALGIASNAAVFSLFDSVFLRPLPFTEPERLVDLDETAPQWNLVHVASPTRIYGSGKTTTQRLMEWRSFGHRDTTCRLVIGQNASRRRRLRKTCWTFCDSSLTLGVTSRLPRTNPAQQELCS